MQSRTKWPPILETQLLVNPGVSTEQTITTNHYNSNKDLITVKESLNQRGTALVAFLTGQDKKLLAKKENYSKSDYRVNSEVLAQKENILSTKTTNTQEIKTIKDTQSSVFKEESDLMEYITDIDEIMENEAFTEDDFPSLINAFMADEGLNTPVTERRQMEFSYSDINVVKSEFLNEFNHEQNQLTLPNDKRDNFNTVKHLNNEVSLNLDFLNQNMFNESDNVELNFTNQSNNYITLSRSTTDLDTKAEDIHIPSSSSNVDNMQDDLQIDLLHSNGFEQETNFSEQTYNFIIENDSAVLVPFNNDSEGIHTDDLLLHLNLQNDGDKDHHFITTTFINDEEKYVETNTDSEDILKQDPMVGFGVSNGNSIMATNTFEEPKFITIEDEDTSELGVIPQYSEIHLKSDEFEQPTIKIEKQKLKSRKRKSSSSISTTIEDEIPPNKRVKPLKLNLIAAKNYKPQTQPQVTTPELYNTVLQLEDESCGAGSILPQNNPDELLTELDTVQEQLKKLSTLKQEMSPDSQDYLTTEKSAAPNRRHSSRLTSTSSEMKYENPASVQSCSSNNTYDYYAVSPLSPCPSVISNGSRKRRGRPPKSHADRPDPRELKNLSDRERQYREQRYKNNEASRQSRLNRKNKELQEKALEDQLLSKNSELKQRVLKLENLESRLRKVLFNRLEQRRV